MSPADSNLNKSDQKIKAIGAPTRMYKTEKLSPTKNYKKQVNKVDSFTSIKNSESISKEVLKKKSNQTYKI